MSPREIQDCQGGRELHAREIDRETERERRKAGGGGG